MVAGVRFETEARRVVRMGKLEDDVVVLEKLQYS